MSKLAKKPIVIPQGVEVKMSDSALEFSGKEGKMAIKLLPFIKTEIKDGQIQFTLGSEEKQGRANLGTIASLTKGAILGVSQGFLKTLEMDGIGYKASMEGTNLVLNVGLTHAVKYPTPVGVKIVVEKSLIKVSGVDKGLVGLTASQIRKVAPPEPYKGKGIHYLGEVIRRKAGKKVAGTGAAA